MCLLVLNWKTWLYLNMDKVEDAPGLEEIGNLFSPSTRYPTPSWWNFLPSGPMQLKFGSLRLMLSLLFRSVTVLKTKFYHAVHVLPQEVASQILDLIRAPPAGDSYEILREYLITLYSLKDYQQFRLWFPSLSWGIRKPCIWWTRCGSSPRWLQPDFILKGLFLRRLPVNVCSHLLQEKVSDPRALD